MYLCRMKSIVVLLLFVLFPVLTVSAADFRGAVDSGTKAFVDAVHAGDAAAIVSLYSDDAIVFPPNDEMVSGKEAIQAFWSSFLQSGVTDVQLETVSTESENDLGVEVGKYTVLGVEGKSLDHGKYVVVWKKVKGSWKLYRDIWNSSMPATPPAQ